MDITPELLRRYATGACTAEEEEAVKRWLSSASAEDEALLPEHKLAEAENNMWESISGSFPGMAETPRVSPWKRSVTYLRYAAALALFAAATAIAFRWFTPTTTETATRPTRQLAIKTAKGEKVVCMLPDSTTVYLNADSELLFPESFSDTSRIVTLYGEGYFIVSRDSLRPFRVATEQASVHVLGTAFNVKAFTTDDLTTVTVTHGKVRIAATENASQAVTLTAGMQVILDERSIIASHAVRTEIPRAWTENKLLFDDEKLADIAPILERWFNVRVVISSEKLKERRFTGQYTNPALKNLMKEMSIVMNFRYTLEERVLYIN